MSTQNRIDRIRTGDQTVLEEIYREYREPFTAWLKKNYHCTHDEALEFYQTSVLICYDNIKCGKLGHLSTTLKTYLFAIGKNKWHEYRRYKQRLQHTPTFDHLELLETPDEVGSAHLVLELRKALITLGDPCRRLLEALYFEKLKLDEIVHSMSYKNKDTSKNVKYKCIQRLRRIMGVS